MRTLLLSFNFFFCLSSFTAFAVVSPSVTPVANAPVAPAPKESAPPSTTPTNAKTLEKTDVNGAVQPSEAALPATSVEGALCRLGAEIRTISLSAVQDQTDKYDVRYTKLGQDQSVGKLKSRESAVGIIRRISKNLADGGWNCREVKKFDVSSNPKDEQSDTHE